MWTRLFIYLFIILIIGGVWVGTTNYGNAALDLDKTKSGLKTVNGTDSDFMQYQAQTGAYSHIQTYVSIISILLFVLVTFLIWQRPIKDAYNKSKTKPTKS